MSISACFERGPPSSLQSDSRDRAIVSSGTPLRIVQQQRHVVFRRKCVNFEMSEVVTVKLSPNRSNIMYAGDMISLNH